MNQELLRSIDQKDEAAIGRTALTLLPRQIERLTMGGSTSVPEETAEALFYSLRFVLTYHTETACHGLFPQGEDAWALLRAAENTIKTALGRTTARFRQVLATAIDLGNIAYGDTLESLKDFPSRYNYRFFAREIPCAIDYQLSHAVDERLVGIAYVDDYLTRLLWENRFCRHFALADIVKLLKVACPDYKGLLINIFTPCAVNAMGLTLLERDPRRLTIAPPEQKALLRLFSGLTPTQRGARLSQCAEALADALSITEEGPRRYLLATAKALLPRIEAALPQGDLSGIFLSFAGAAPTREGYESFVDNPPMSNAALRRLMARITDQTEVEAKIALVHREVHSIGDLMEILNLCFWGDEAQALLASLDTATRALLKQESRSPQHTPGESGWETWL